MISKKAIELSLNFIVVIIISIILFGFGIRFLSKLSSEAVELQELTINELDEKIGSLVCEGSDRVCIGVDKKTIPRKKFDVFGLKVINVLEPEAGQSGQYFDIIVKPSNPIGATKEGQPITGPSLKINPASRPSVFIEKNGERNFGIGIEVPKDALSGTYIFDIEIKTPDGSLYVPVQKLYVEVP